MTRRLRPFILMIVIAFIAFTATIAYGEYVCGDANSDGLLNVSDAVYVINYVFIGGSAPDPGCCGLLTSTVTDIDGNVYKTIKIGDQWWMAQNLMVTAFHQGSPITAQTDDGIWSGLSIPARCDYINIPGYAAAYGRMYNWYAASDVRNIAPEGWHVPSDAEWKQLEIQLGMNQAAADLMGWRGTNEGGMLKERGLAHWASPNTGANNESELTMLAGGYRQADGTYSSLRFSGLFWTVEPFGTSDAWMRQLDRDRSEIFRDVHDKREGLYIRCVKD